MLYIEPFFGEGSVFWSKEPSAAEFINDRSGAVTGLYGKMALSGRNRVWVLTTDPKEMLRLAEGKDVFIFIDPPAQARKNGVLDSCAVDRDETVRRSVAEAELRLIMFRIESRIMHLDAISDPEYIAIALKVCALIDMLCDILSARLTMKSKCDKVSRKKEN
jgi:hypothetical protein